MKIYVIRVNHESGSSGMVFDAFTDADEARRSRGGVWEKRSGGVEHIDGWEEQPFLANNPDSGSKYILEATTLHGV